MAEIQLIAKTATQGLKVLWREEFFEKPRKMQEISENFSKRHHNFSNAELGMALKRAKYLIRRGNRLKYEYIQKYPYTGEKNEKHRRNK